MAADVNPSATVTVQFTNPGAVTANNAHLSAEVDSRPDPVGLNGGRTTFIPGDNVAILVYKSNNVRLVSAETTSGTISQTGTSLVEKREDIQFNKMAIGDLGIPAKRIIGWAWHGRDLGTPVLSPNGQHVTVEREGLGILSLHYEVETIVGTLQSPDEVGGLKDFSIAVLITGEVTAGVEADYFEVPGNINIPNR